MEVKIEPAYDRPQEVARLFGEYMDAIIKQDAEVEKCLAAQNYKDEINVLHEKYGLPGGRLYLATLDGRAAGCIALKRFDDACCEMKRLYVKPEYRGKRIGNALVERVLSDAREIGYKHMRLDTFPCMESALKMYRRYGFYEIDRYNDNPAINAVYMQLDL